MPETFLTNMGIVSAGSGEAEREEEAEECISDGMCVFCEVMEVQRSPAAEEVTISGYGEGRRGFVIRLMSVVEADVLC